MWRNKQVRLSRRLPGRRIYIQLHRYICLMFSCPLNVFIKYMGCNPCSSCECALTHLLTHSITQSITQIKSNQIKSINSATNQSINQPINQTVKCENTHVFNDYQWYCNLQYFVAVDVLLHRYHTDINECLSNPCQNGGTCSNHINSYTCACVLGYTGTNCQTSR